MGTTDGVVGAVTLDSQTSVVLSSRSQASSFTVLVNRVDNPVNAGIVSDGNVGRIDKNNLEVLVGRVLVNPVRVQYTHVHGVSARALLSNTAQVTSILQLVNTLVLGLTENNTLGVGPLAAPAANSNAEDGVSLLGLVSELVGLVSSGRTGNFLHFLALTILPSSVKKRVKSKYQYGAHKSKNAPQVFLPNTKEETKSITLLLSPDLFKVLVGSHCDE